MVSSRNLGVEGAQSLQEQARWRVVPANAPKYSTRGSRYVPRTFLQEKVLFHPRCVAHLLIFIISDKVYYISVLYIELYSHASSKSLTARLILLRSTR